MSLAAVELKPPHKLPLSILGAGTREMNPLKEVVNRATILLKEEDSIAYFNYRADRLVAAAVTQAFSYMMENGLEYGYVGTGEAFVFSHVRDDDPETVYYLLCIPNDEAGEDTGWRPGTRDENRLHLTAVAQVSAFCLQAVQTTTRSQKWQENVSQMVAKGIEAIHALGVLHRDVATRNMLWNEECGRVMFVDFERSVVFKTKQKQRRPLGMISGNRKGEMAFGATEDDT